MASSVNTLARIIHDPNVIRCVSLKLRDSTELAADVAEIVRFSEADGATSEIETSC